MTATFGLSVGLLCFLLSSFGAIAGPSSSARSPTTGPCIINDDGRKCTSHGYYEQVQCMDDSCFCVAPHTGWVAYDTTTKNNKTVPKCGSCFVQLQKIFANGYPSTTTFIPKCELGLGDYEPLQCDGKKDQCFCVDAKTGAEKAGTRKPRGETGKMSCNQIEFSIDSSEFPVFTKNATNPNSFPFGRDSCALDRDRGRKCADKKTSIKYFFDKKSTTCLAFEHLGCGGNENSYKSKSECLTACVMADYFTCGGATPPARQSNGQTFTCGNQPQFFSPPGETTTAAPKMPGPELNQDGCPNGYRCSMGAFFGFCCHTKSEERAAALWRLKCRNGKKTKSAMAGGIEETLLGKSCGDNFCPTGHTCESNELFAYCCPK